MEKIVISIVIPITITILKILIDNFNVDRRKRFSTRIIINDKYILIVLSSIFYVFLYYLSYSMIDKYGTNIFYGLSIRLEVFLLTLVMYVFFILKNAKKAIYLAYNTSDSDPYRSVDFIKNRWLYIALLGIINSTAIQSYLFELNINADTSIGFKLWYLLVFIGFIAQIFTSVSNLIFTTSPIAERDSINVELKDGREFKCNEIVEYDSTYKFTFKGIENDEFFIKDIYLLKEEVSKITVEKKYKFKQLSKIFTPHNTPNHEHTHQDICDE